MSTSLRPGHIEISGVLLSNGKISRDVLPMMVELNVWENIMSHTVTGTLTLVDTYNMLSEFPLNGEELVVFTFRSSKDLPWNTITFRVFGVGDRVPGGSAKQVYKLKLASHEAVIDSTVQVERAYYGSSDVIVEKILKNELKSGKKLVAEKSGNNIKLVPPLWSPFKCIHWATQKAVTQDKERVPAFVFFERIDAYVFVSLHSLFSTKAAHYYEISDSRTVTEDFTPNYTQELYKVHQWAAPTVVDQLERFALGYHHTKTTAVDWTFKDVRISHSRMDDLYKQTRHLNLHPLFTKISSDKGTQLNNHIHLSSLAHDGIIDEGDLIKNKRLQSLAQTQLSSIQIEVWGNSNVSVGQVVYLRVPNIKDQVDTKDTEDKWFTGRYLISGVTHRFAPAEHKMTLNLVRDSSMQEIK